MADNLLDKASILLTPTAYDNGRMLSVKPSKDLYGSELVTNGDFATDSNWNKGANWSILNGVATSNGAGLIQQSTSDLTPGKTYKISFEITEYTSGGVKLYSGSGSDASTYKNTVGTHTDTLVLNGSTTSLYSNNFIGSISNVSVKEDLSGDFQFSRGSAATRVNAQGLVENVQIISSELVSNGDFSQEGSELVTNGDFATDSDWTLGTGWSIGDGVAISDGSSGYSFLQQTGAVDNGKVYRLTYSVTNYVSGTVEVGVGGASNNNIQRNSVGDFVEYHTSNGTNLTMISRSFIGSIDNISVKEVGQNWTLGTGWSIGDGVINFSNPTGTELYQALSTTIGKYKIKFDLNITSGTCQTSFTSPSTSTVESFTTSGTKEVIIETTSNYSRFRFVGLGGSDLTITNISVKEVTDDTDLPRINYENGIGSWLLEPQSTNLIPYSTDFSTWLYGSDVFPNNMTRVDGQSSPDGGTNSSLYTRNSGTSGFFGYGNTTVVLGNTYTYSIFIKKGTSSTIQINNVANQPQSKVTYNIDTDTFTQEQNASGKAVNFGNGWYRVSMTFEHTNTGSTNSQVRNYLGDGESMYVFGSQLEQQSFATSYIPTDGAANTRLQDIASNSGNASLINSTEGVLYAEISALANDGTNRIISISDGTIANRVQLNYSTNSNRFGALISSGGVLSCFFNITLIDITQFNKIALKYKENDFALWINGVKVATDTSGDAPIGIDKLSFTFNNGTGLPFYGKVKALAVYKEALTDEQLTALTTI